MRSRLTIFAKMEVWVKVQVVRALGFPLELGWWGRGIYVAVQAHRNGFTYNLYQCTTPPLCLAIVAGRLRPSFGIGC